ncbi:MAG: UDP-3-O-acyl-N-acetylglucosamine deacetylase [Vampirovibrionales bacterium]|nr:UDP-3-O-acyl-N-acetylglucosamine deacetylase [Vampirovibrionales bacterium]
MPTATASLSSFLLSPSAVSVSGIGLITGLPVTVTLAPALVGQGITFQLPNRAVIPASLATLADANRGVTLIDPATSKTLSIVEHFLCACALSNRLDVRVTIEMATDAPLWELPLLDGSAADWLPFLNQLSCRGEESPLELTKALWYRQNDDVCIYALPSDRLQMTYAINLDHAETANQWARWDSATDDILTIASSRTFGLLRELPALQASGMARGVSLENTLGLVDDGTTTSPLRHPQEPLFHKMLDLLGDLMLIGLNPLRLNAHLIAINAGHASHTAFGKLVWNHLKASV